MTLNHRWAVVVSTAFYRYTSTSSMYVWCMIQTFMICFPLEIGIKYAQHSVCLARVSVMVTIFFLLRTRAWIRYWKFNKSILSPKSNMLLILQPRTKLNDIIGARLIRPKRRIKRNQPHNHLTELELVPHAHQSTMIGNDVERDFRHPFK